MVIIGSSLKKKDYTEVVSDTALPEIKIEKHWKEIFEEDAKVYLERKLFLLILKHAGGMAGKPGK